MAMKNFILFYTIIVLSIFLPKNYAATSELMPALYKFDNYQDCFNNNNLEQNLPAKYCMILIQLQPNLNSSLWHQINEISKSKFRYRHDHIFRGVCVNKDNNVKNDKQFKGFHKGLLINEQTEEIQQVFNNPLDHEMRSQFHNEIYDRINQEYLNNYNLSTKTFVNYCTDPQQRKPKDIYFKLTITVIIIIILLNIFSSLYDAKLKPSDKDNYYELKHNDKVTRYLTSFSLYRNYKRLVLPNKSDIGQDLAFLDGFRTILCLLILLEHVLLLEYTHLKDSNFVYTSLNQLWCKLLLNAVVWLELFFVLSGLLLYVKFEKAQYISTKSSFMDCLTVFGRLLMSRYLRYLPSLLFIIIFQSNISYYHEHGTFTRFIMEANCLACREKWWKNILMIVNFDMKKSCLMHTWYIAADFHLYGLFLLLLIIIAKFPKIRTFVLFGVAVLAAAINFGLNYYFKLDSIMTFLPENYRYFYLRNIETAKYLYFSSYTNINSFLLGIVCGLIYMKHLHNNDANKKKLSKILKYSSYMGWLCIAAILYLGTQIMEHTETTIITASYGLLQRHVGLTIVAIIVILRGICNGGGIFKSKPFRFFARISFQFYLWQIVILLHYFAYHEQPINVNIFIVCWIYIVIFISTILVAFLVALFVEYPFAEIVSIINIEKKLKSVKTE